MRQLRITLGTALVVTCAALALVPAAGATADTATRGAATGKAATMIKRQLDIGHVQRGSAKRRPPATRKKTAVARAAVFYTNECAINKVFDYLPNSTILPYTWREFTQNGVRYGYEQFSRYGWRTEWPSGYDRPSVSTCSWALGYQYEMFKVVSGYWQWYATVNCDVNNYCWTARSR